VPLSHSNVPRRPLLVLLSPISKATYSHLPTSYFTLAYFLNRRAHSQEQNCRPRNRRSRSQPPVPPTSEIIFPPLPHVQTIRPIHQANASEPVFPTVARIITNNPRSTEPVSLLPDRDTLQHRTPPRSKAHQIQIRPQELHCYFPEELYLSSVLPTRTHRELRYFQNHCWNIYHRQHQQPCNFIHGLDESRRITTSPLHFVNLLWRTTTAIDRNGITEEYHWIKKRTIPHRPDIPYLQPAFSVTYPWVEIFWKTTQLDRSLPPTPTA
jgi:hypothetical protein